MKKFLMVCLGILLVGCGKEEIADREKDGRNVDSSQQLASAHTQPPPSAEQGGMAGVANVEPVQGEPLAVGRLTELSVWPSRLTAGSWHWGPRREIFRRTESSECGT